MNFIFDAERVGKWVCEKAGGQYKEGNTAIGVEKDGELIIGIMYDGYTGSNICMHSRCDNPRIVPKKFYWMIFDYPFNQLNVKVVHVIVCETNSKAIKVNEHLGFKREAVLGDYFPEGDAIVYVMRRDDCRFLGEKYVHFAQRT